MQIAPHKTKRKSPTGISPERRREIAKLANAARLAKRERGHLTQITDRRAVLRALTGGVILGIDREKAEWLLKAFGDG